MSDNNSGGCVVGFGSIISAFLSYALNHSFWWAVLHFFLGWVYVLYVLFFRLHDFKVWFNSIQ